MTERQAWLRLAKGHGTKGSSRRGLCMHIWDMGELGTIDTDVHDAMLARIGPEVKAHPWHNGKVVTGWAWPIDDEGHKARVAFCRRQVARIDRARAKRKARAAKRRR